MECLVHIAAKYEAIRGIGEAAGALSGRHPAAALPDGPKRAGYAQLSFRQSAEGFSQLLTT